MNEHDESSTRFPSPGPFADAKEIPSGVLPRDVLNLGFSPYRTMWFNPRETIRRIVNVNPEYHVNLLFVLSGIAKSLDRSSARTACDKYSIELVLAIVVIGGSLGALLGAWLYSHFIRITGNWMGGRGEYEQIKAALGWSALPSATGLALWIPLLLIFGKQMFMESGPALAGNPALAIIYSAFISALSAFGLWSIILACQAVAEVQGYTSAWKGFANIFLGGALLVVIMVAVIVTFFLSLDH